MLQTSTPRLMPASRYLGPTDIPTATQSPPLLRTTLGRVRGKPTLANTSGQVATHEKDAPGRFHRLATPTKSGTIRTFTDTEMLHAVFSYPCIPGRLDHEPRVPGARSRNATRWLLNRMRQRSRHCVQRFSITVNEPSGDSHTSFYTGTTNASSNTRGGCATDGNPASGAVRGFTSIRALRSWHRIRLRHSERRAQHAVPSHPVFDPCGIRRQSLPTVRAPKCNRLLFGRAERSAVGRRVDPTVHM